MLRKLRIKFICIIMFIAVVFMCNVVGIIVFNIYGELAYESEEYLMFRTDRYFKHTDEEPPHHMPMSPYFLLQKNTDGSLEVLDSHQYELGDEAQLAEYFDAAKAQKYPGGLLREYSLRFLGSRAKPNVIAFMDSTNEMHMRLNMWKTCIAICLGSLVVFFFISLFLARWAVKPVEVAWKQQNQFISDVSHELKTPLTVILTNTEMLRAEESGNKYAANIDVMSQQMRGLVESLLELARMDSGSETLEHTEVDFSKVVSDAVLPFEPIFFEKELSLDSEVESGVRVRGSADHLLHVMDILLDNAQKYTSEHSSVKVKLTSAKGQCCLSVASTGDEISREDLENIFTRFYRVDKARAMNHSYGLGLAIARGIVVRHSGKIWAESKNGVNTFFVTLPVK